MTEHVNICEVGPRDGLQIAKTRMATAAKIRWIAAMAAAGVREIEVGSFVPPRVIPQMADTAEVVRRSLDIPGLTVIALVLSWLVSVYFVPYLGTLLLKVKPHDPDAPPHELFDSRFYNIFRRTVNWCVEHRWLTIGATSSGSSSMWLITSLTTRVPRTTSNGSLMPSK